MATREMRAAAALVLIAMATGCSTIDDDAFEPNDDLAHATHLSVGGTGATLPNDAPPTLVDAVVLYDNDDVFVPAVAGAVRWDLKVFSDDNTAGPTGTAGTAVFTNFAHDQLVCIDEGSIRLPPPPRLVCKRDHDGFFFDTDADAVVVHQPLCTACVDRGSTAYELALTLLPPS